MSFGLILAIVIISLFALLLLSGTVSEEKKRSGKSSFNSSDSFQSTLERTKQGYEREHQPISKPVINQTEDEDLPYTLRFEVTGLYYRDAEAHAAARFLEKGDTVILRHERGNEYDENAVQIFTINGVFIGYVPKYLSYLIRHDLRHLESCKVIRTTSEKIPHIDIEAEFSEGEFKQPSFIPKELQLSAEDKMLSLGTGHQQEDKYWNVQIMVRGTFEESPQAIAKARKLRYGDPVILKKADPSEYFKHRIDVYTSDDTMIGFIDRDKVLYDNFDKVHSSMIAATLDRHPALTVSAFLPKDGNIQYKPDLEGMIMDYSGAYPQLSEAEHLKRTEPERALEIALPVAAKETGIRAKFLCCQCYRNLKDYESERVMIQKILERIDTITEDNADPADYYYAKNNADTMLRRLNTVETRLKNQKK